MLFAVLLIVALIIATFAMLVAGLINMSKSVHGEPDGEGPSERALKSNKLMWYRIYFQFAAVAVMGLLFWLVSAGK